jgi:FMN phosphatase YigB (HAD superfamily)
LVATSKKKRLSGKRTAPKRKPRPLITTVLFDLDDTLYDCFNQRVRGAHRHAAEAMVAAGVPGTVDAILKLRMKAFERDPQLAHIDGYVCAHYGITETTEIVRRSRAAYFSSPVGQLTLFPGVSRLLRALERRGVRVFVVSFGDPATQHAKVRSLGLDREPAIEKIFLADTGKTITKEGIFQSVLRNVEPDPARVLVVGDRPSSEIKAGKSLGMHTVRVKGGEFAHLPPRGPDEVADRELVRVTDLLKLPFRFDH